MKKKLGLLMLISLTGAFIIEYYGWIIIEKYTGESVFPGFQSPVVLKSAFINSLGSWLFGLIILAFMSLFPQFRNNIKNKIHIPLYAGVILFMIYMTVLIFIGLYT
jgi:hypothetical protein